MHYMKHARLRVVYSEAGRQAEASVIVRDIRLTDGDGDGGGGLGLSVKKHENETESTSSAHLAPEASPRLRLGREGEERGVMNTQTAGRGEEERKYGRRQSPEGKEKGGGRAPQKRGKAYCHTRSLILCF